jgi:hypothetical protein
MNFTRYIIKFIKNIPHTYGNMRYHTFFTPNRGKHTQKRLKIPCAKARLRIIGLRRISRDSHRHACDLKAMKSK